MLLPALLAPKVDATQFQALKGRASPLGALANEAEFLVQWLEPLVLDGVNPQPHIKPAWVEFSRMKAYLDEFISPANATVTIVGGFDPVAVLPLLTHHAGGARRSIRRVATRNDVNAKVPAERSVHIIGYPLPELTAEQAAAMRVINAMLYEALTISLRERGLAYSVAVEPDLTPWFNGVLLIVPAFDLSGSDLEPFLAEQIGRVVHQRLTPDTLQRFREGVQLEDGLARQQPALFVDRLAAARVAAAWLSPEHVQALEALTPEQVAKTSSALFVNERRRFYVKFTPVTAAPRKRGP
jgi:predicted Zn-dependent peptidase